MRHIIVIVTAALAVVLALPGCALLKQGLNEAENGIEPNQEALPQGKGWSCYLAGDAQWSGCWRTAEECATERSKNQVEAKSAGMGQLSFGPCQPALQAACTTYNQMETQADGSGKFVPRADCMPDPTSCQKFADGLRQKSANTRVSKCATLP